MVCSQLYCTINHLGDVWFCDKKNPVFIRVLAFRKRLIPKDAVETALTEQPEDAGETPSEENAFTPEPRYAGSKREIYMMCGYFIKMSTFQISNLRKPGSL